MKTSEVLGWGVLVLIIVALGVYAFSSHQGSLFSGTASSTEQSSGGTGTGTASGPVTFYCTEGQINATFSKSAVQIDLSTNNYFTLPQVMSGSGVRYEATTTAGKDELFESEGSWAQLLENGKAIYSNCVAAHVSDAGGGYKTFVDESNVFSFKYPNAFAIVGTAPGYSTSWMVNATSSGMLLAEVQLPATAMPKTNFVGANFTVGVSSDPAAVGQCLTYNPTGGPKSPPKNATIAGLEFVKFTSSDAGAGNFYDTTSYRIIRDGQCYAIEYTIHSGNIGNYPKGTVTAFNETTIAAELDQIAQSFKFLQ